MMMGHRRGMARETEKAQDIGATLRRLIVYLKPHALQLTIAGLMMVLNSLFQLVGPYLTGRAVDKFIVQKDLAGLNRTMLLLLGAYVGSWLTRGVQSISTIKMGQQVLYDMRNQIFRHFQRLSLGFFDRSEAGDLMSRLTNDTDAINRTLNMGLPQFVGNLFFLTGTLAAMLLLALWLRREPLRRVLSWFFGDRPCPRGFKRYLPPIGDAPAWRLLESLYRPVGDEGDTALHSLAAVLGAEVTAITRDISGWTATLQGLQTPGFHALASAAWPNGIPIWRPLDSSLPNPPLAPGDIQIRLCEGNLPSPQPDHLYLDIHDVLAVLSQDEEQRRAAILATLGPQLPLESLFDSRIVDPTLHGSFEPIIREAQSTTRPLLISGAPGVGRQALLASLAEQLHARVFPASHEDLPEDEPFLLVDARQDPDERGARRLVRAIHWISDGSPSPTVIVVASPEIAQRLDSMRADFFTTRRLEPWSHLKTRWHAATMLAWGGIRPSDPGLMDHLALQSGGNPRALFLLCESLAHHLAKHAHRRFDKRDLDAAWSSKPLRTALHRLLWRPLEAVEDTKQVASALVRFCDPGQALPLSDLVWAVGEEGPAHDEGWVLGRLQLLEDYGFTYKTRDGIGLRSTGPALLLRQWVNLAP